MSTSAYDRAFSRLAALTNYENMAAVRYDSLTRGLRRVRALLDACGRPCDDRAVLQVVGSKGKGTAAAAASSILRAAGLRTGTFVSPHLEHPRERILLDGRPVGGRRFGAAVDRVLPVALARCGDARPTFFELMTAVALLLFEEAGADAVVLEAGLGGRLDATTAPRRSALLLTGVSRDHVRQLGCTLSSIAGEKIAAARRGVPVHSTVRDGSPQGRVVRGRCRSVRAPLRVLGRDFHVDRVDTSLEGLRGRTRFDLRIGDGAALERLEVPVLGAHQASNAALAAAAVLDLAARGIVRCDGTAVRRGLRRVAAPARLEPVRRDPLVLLDGAHNGASVRAAVEGVRAVAPDGGRLHVVLAMQRDKEFDDVVRALPGGARIVVTETAGPRRKPAVELAARARAAGHRPVVVADAATALDRALDAASPRDVVLVTGSLYLAGALRPRILRGT